MKKLIKQLFCSHPRLTCQEVSLYGLEPETRIRYTNPWALFPIKETLYLCTKCKKQFFYPKGEMAYEIMNEQFLVSLQTKKPPER